MTAVTEQMDNILWMVRLVVPEMHFKQISLIFVYFYKLDTYHFTKTTALKH